MDLKTLSQEIRNCKKCGLCESRQNVVIGRGSQTPKIVIIGEAPGEAEDAAGKPFVGRSGMLLDRCIAENGIKDFCILNILKCRPPENRKPTPEEVAACKPWLDQQLELLNPELVVCLGATALNFFFPSKKISEAIGQTLKDDQGRRFVGLYHPSYALRGAIKIEDYIKSFERVNFFLGDGQMGKSREALVGDPQPNPLRSPIPNGPQPTTPLPTGFSTEQRYVPLHVHWEHGSVADVYGTDKERAEDFFKKGFKAAAITDHGSLSSLIYAQTALKEKGIKPIIGIECYINEGPRKASHLILLVKNEIGYKNLLKLHTLAKQNTHKIFNKVYQKISLDEVCKHSEGLICSTACLSGIVANRWKKDDYVAIDSIILKLKNAFKDDFYLEMQPNRLKPVPKDPMLDQEKFNEFLFTLARKHHIKLIITTDSHYNNPEDKKYHDLIKANDFRLKITDKIGFGDNTFANLTTEQIEELLKTNHPKIYPIMEELFANTLEVANKCTFELPSNLGDTLPGIEEEAREKILKRIDIEGYIKKNNYDPLIVNERIKKEVDLLTSRKFFNYFDKVMYMVDYADSHNIPRGPGRGSVGGSLLAYLLGITRVDPLRFNTLWERFLTPTRTPDIDMDFSAQKRESIIGSLRLKYGPTNVSYIMTFNEWSDKSAIKDVARIYDVPLSEVNKFNKELSTKTAENLKIEDIILTSETAAEFAKKYPEVIDAAVKLKGKIRHVGLHAAGVVICKDLESTIPTEIYDKGDIKNCLAASFEKDMLERLGIIKFDVLGISVLDVIDGTLKSSGLGWDVLPEDYADPKIFELLKSSKTAGIFQFGSQLVTDYLRHLNPDKFDDLVAVNALCRPGPLNSGMSFDYIDRKGGKEWTYDHSKLESITKDTYGIIAYQEQIMEVAHEIGNFSMVESEAFMKAIAKSKGKETLKEKYDQFVFGSLENGLKNEEIESLFNKILEFGRYGFNKCLTGDTEVVDAKTGETKTLENIYNLKEYPTVLSLDKNLKLCNNEIETIYNNGKKPVYRITTHLGKQIKSTGTHRFLTIDGWQPIQDLKPLDRIALPRLLPVKSFEDIEDFRLTVLGYALSEGNMCHTHGFYVFSSDENQIKEYCNALIQFENTKYKISYKYRSLCPSVYAGRINLKEPSEAVEWIKSLGMYGKRATEKVIPEFVFKLNPQKIAFLIAKMWEGDGCINITKAGQISLYYATSSHKMAQQMQHLLLRLGIVSSLHTKKFKYKGSIKIGYTIVIAGRYNSIAFCETIGKFLSTKKSTMEKVKTIFNSYETNQNGLLARGSKDLISAYILPEIQSAILDKGFKDLKHFAKELGISERSLYLCNKKNGYRRETIKIIGEGTNSEYLTKLGNSDIYWDEIKSIEYVGEEKTYDLCMKNNHNFIANDIVVHNSHSVEYSMLGYWTAWLKLYYPLAFYSSLINVESDEVQSLSFVKEAMDSGVIIKPPSIESPSELTTFDKNKNIIYLGLNKVKGIGPEEIKKVLAAGDDFNKINKIKKNVFQTLVEVGYLDSIESNRKQLLSGKELTKNTLWAWHSEPNTSDDWSEEEKMFRLRKSLPWPRSYDELPKIKHEAFRKPLSYLKSETIENKAILSVGWVYDHKAFSSNGKTSYVLNYEDGTSRVTLNLSAVVARRHKDIIDKIVKGEQKNPLIFCLHPYYMNRGHIEVREGKLQILWMGNIEDEMSKNILRGLEGDTETLGSREFLVTNISYGTSKAGNGFASIECINNAGEVTYGALMDRGGILPMYGSVIRGKWNVTAKGTFWNGE
jgi:DNA polymerase-3 subunit alpha